MYLENRSCKGLGWPKSLFKFFQNVTENLNELFGQPDTNYNKHWVNSHNI